MRIACVGGGPGGLYFSILSRLHRPEDEVTVYERLPAGVDDGCDAGWGVTYWADFLETLAAHDEVSARAVAEASADWTDGAAYVRDERTDHHGDREYGIGRARLLAVLAERAQELGVRLRYRQEVSDPAELPPADLLVVADGVNSRLRDRSAAQFGTRVTEGRHRYLWLGTDRVLPGFTFAFAETPHGWIWCYAYPFSADRSTVVVECPETTWRGLEFDRLGREETLHRLALLFAKPLDGHGLLSRSNRPEAPWQRFRTVVNDRWYHGSTVLLGDAAHTTHYSIGAGTKLAMEDGIALAGALHRAEGRTAEALAAYQRERRRALLPAQHAARTSARWFEEVPRYLRLRPERFFALLGHRHSPLLPYLPPAVGYHLHQATAHPAVRGLRRWAGPRLAAAAQATAATAARRTGRPG